MVLAAVRIASSSRLMSRSAESDAPMAFSWSRRWTRSSAAVGAIPAGKRSLCVESVLAPIAPSILFDADGAHFFDLRDAGETLFHAVLLQRAHAVLEALGEHLGDARVLLDELFQLVGGDQQLVQATAAFKARAAALVAADGPVEGQLPLVVAVGLHPVLVHRLHRALGVGLEARRVHQLLA